MKIVIDIPEDDFYMIQRVVEMGIGSSVDKLIYSGTPFPKGHGRLIDADDKTIDKKREFVAIDRVLDIIDAEAWSYVDYIIKHGNRNAYKQKAACHLSENIRNAVMALKGGDKE